MQEQGADCAGGVPRCHKFKKDDYVEYRSYSHHHYFANGRLQGLWNYDKTKIQAADPLHHFLAHFRPDTTGCHEILLKSAEL